MTSPRRRRRGSRACCASPSIAGRSPSCWGASDSAREVWRDLGVHARPRGTRHPQHPGGGRRSACARAARGRAHRQRLSRPDRGRRRGRDQAGAGRAARPGRARRAPAQEERARGVRGAASRCGRSVHAHHRGLGGGRCGYPDPGLPPRRRRLPREAVLTQGADRAHPPSAHALRRGRRGAPARARARPRAVTGARGAQARAR